ncbi:cell cycle exit and neuronal differentiation protein 1-like isoform X1 [Clinocottus analis]|uniref:cell cycle exit and neuronal differentiation protein 1-like isoform X1 n=1 Tax=Clinocottus analis TaxID=304258 RepID=UPI0035C22562
MTHIWTNLLFNPLKGTEGKMMARSVTKAYACPPSLFLSFSHSKDILTSRDCCSSSSICYSCNLYRAAGETTPLSMEAKAKSGAPIPKAAPKAEKKEPAAPRKADPAPAAPAAPAASAAPAAPEPEHPPPQDGVAEAEAAAASEEAATSCTDSLEHLKPFLIGGAVIATGAILLGVLLLARRN